MHIFPKKQRPMLLLVCAALLVMSGCDLASAFPPIVARPAKTQPYLITPMLSPLQPYRVVELCLDGPPLYPASYAHAAATALANSIDAALVPGMSGMTIFISAITSSSYQKTVLSFTVPSILIDQPEPALQPVPTSATAGQSPYDFAQAVAAIKQENQERLTTWQASLTRNHHYLEDVRRQVRQYTDALRRLLPITDPVADDPLGCVATASSHFHLFSETKIVKTLLIASPLRQNTSVNATTNIHLSGVSVNVIWFPCETASVCDATKATWTQRLLSFGARSVAFFDVAASIVEQPTFEKGATR